jgi:hypothetical protein
MVVFSIGYCAETRVEHCGSLGFAFFGKEWTGIGGVATAIVISSQRQLA